MVNSNGINDLKSLYEHLESNALDYEYDYQIGDLFQKAKLLNDENNKPIESGKAQWEVDFFYFNINMGKLEPAMSQTFENGSINKYPDLDKFDDNTYDYLIKRLNSTENPLLKARYATILWNSPRKHRKYAEIVVDSYMDLINIYKKMDKNEPNKNWGLKIIDAAQNAYKIALQSKYEVNNVKSEIIRLIHLFNLKSDNSITLRHHLVKLMLNEKRNFTKEDFKDIDDILWTISKSLTKANAIQRAIDILKLGDQIKNKTGTEKYSWQKEIAKSYEILMEDAESNENPAALYFCQMSLEYYNKVKDKVKVSELEKKYLKFKDSQIFKKIEIPVDLKGTLKRCREIAKELSEKDSNEIIKYLMFDVHILPKYSELEKFVEEVLLKQYFSSNFPKTAVDRAGHVSQHFSEPEEIKYAGILGQFKMELEMNTINLLNEVFLTAIRENKLSYDILLNYLINNSWYGKTIENEFNGKKIVYNWLNVISPALFDYFVQIYYYLLNPSNVPNLVLVIDSLSLKMEGLIRDICQNCGVITFYQAQDKKGRNITREKDINALLREDSLKNLFTKDEILFFKFLLIEKKGYNLRHNVAHSLISHEEYNIGIAHLLILLLLRLGKFDFPKAAIKEKM